MSIYGQGWYIDKFVIATVMRKFKNVVLSTLLLITVAIINIAFAYGLNDYFGGRNQIPGWISFLFILFFAVSMSYPYGWLLRTWKDR